MEDTDIRICDTVHPEHAAKGNRNSVVSVSPVVKKFSLRASVSLW